MNKALKTILIILAVIVLLAVVIIGCIGHYNRVIAMDEQISAQWAQVENQLKIRYDLIPNLVETFKGYAKHEKEIFMF